MTRTIATEGDLSAEKAKLKAKRDNIRDSATNYVFIGFIVFIAMIALYVIGSCAVVWVNHLGANVEAIEKIETIITHIASSAFGISIFVILRRSF